ncbi:MAG: glycoside hydrolase family 3 C-terminal domain-containing protein [Oscillospiraceae bacterium]|nr:glycoside hydrolase family 3 C-terminal domain-containing protein [Oscillospiraceae bacterium]
MAKMNPLQLGIYAATGKLVGKLPVKEAALVARKAAEGGIVLLKNDGTLPLKKGKIALFGNGSSDTSVCGTGSGYAFSPYTATVKSGLSKAGYEITSGLWFKNYETFRKEESKKSAKLTFLDKRFSGKSPEIGTKPITSEELHAASSADTAFYVITRNAGEGGDRLPQKGDYYLTDTEEKNIRLLTETFAHTVIILNTGILDCSLLEEINGVSAIVLLGQAGLEAGNALAAIVSGEVSPSGRITDTFAKRYEDYPASATFSSNDGNVFQEDYTEDIYVGYRYFDTKKLDVVYPFGYGLSYTSFEYRNAKVEADWDKVKVTVDVVNLGSRPSRDVVQLYASAPAGKLKKPYQELRAFAKTGIIAPSKEETVTLTFPTSDLSSYDMDLSAWVMEKGTYLLRLGANSRKTEVVGAVELDEDVRTVQLSRHFELDRELELLDLPYDGPEAYEGERILLHAADCITKDEASKIQRELPVYTLDGELQAEAVRPFDVTYEEKAEKVRSVKNATLLDVVDGKITMEEFVATLDDEILARLVAGAGQETPYKVEPRLPKNALKVKNNGSTSGQITASFASSLGIPPCSLADGPAGLHLMGTPTAAYPVGMVLAQNFDPEIVSQVGDMYGREMELKDIGLCLGPGMNIHRDPLCGRNFEYYSEDPLVTGKSAAAFINGLQKNHPGFGVAAKHFCCNSQEEERTKSNSSVSERALREIYLKGFEIAVKESKPLTIMSSYNLLNGVHTSSRYDLLTDVLRGEWGFDGFVMTDWDGDSDRIMDLNAGNDIIMGGYPSDAFLSALEDRKPEFKKDGSVSKKKIAMYGGAMHREMECYNSFLPDAQGPDTVTVELAAEPSESLKELEEKGIVTVDKAASKVTYKGWNRAGILRRSVLQRNAMRVLNYLAYGAPMKMAKRQ